MNVRPGEALAGWLGTPTEAAQWRCSEGCPCGVLDLFRKKLGEFPFVLHDGWWAGPGLLLRDSKLPRACPFLVALPDPEYCPVSMRQRGQSESTVERALALSKANPSSIPSMP